MRCTLQALDKCLTFCKKERMRRVFIHWCSDAPGYKYRTKHSLLMALQLEMPRHYITSAFYELQKAGLIDEVKDKSGNSYLIESDTFIKIRLAYSKKNIIQEDDIGQDIEQSDIVEEQKFEEPIVTKQSAIADKKSINVEENVESSVKKIEDSREETQELAKIITQNLKSIPNWRFDDVVNAIVQNTYSDTTDEQIMAIINLVVHNKCKPEVFWNALKHKDGSKKSKQEFRDDVFFAVQNRISLSLSASNATKGFDDSYMTISKEDFFEYVVPKGDFVDHAAIERVNNMFREAGLKVEETIKKD